MPSQSPASIAFYAINQARYNGLTCTYTSNAGIADGATPIVVSDVPVNLGRSKLVDDDGAGGRIESDSSDFIVPSAPLQAAISPGALFTPQKGDTVRLVSPIGWLSVYELMTPPFSPHDHAGEFFRLHGNLISSRGAPPEEMTL